MTTNRVQPTKIDKSISDHPTVDQFAEDATIHGVKDLDRSWHRESWSKWIWLILLLTLTAFMFYEMSEVVIGYLARPTATQISQIYKEAYDYPLMLFCPTAWINANKVKRLGLPKHLLAYALAFQYMINVQIDSPIS
jgi:hypothetical protein